MFHIEKSSKDISPTSKGKLLIELVSKKLKSPLMTAKWEIELDIIIQKVIRSLKLEIIGNGRYMYAQK